MSDRELLELAAKAAGFANWSYAGSSSGICVELGASRGAITSYWNPLTDDGDALRLAVKLGCQLVISPEIGITDCKIGEGDWCFGGEHHHPDGYAATRRAIVRAAAEIGKRL